MEQRLIECEKALLNTLELGIILPTNFMEMPEINNRSLEIIAQMQAYIMDPNFRSILLATLPPLESNSRHHADGSTSKQSKETENDSIDAKNVGGDQESDVDSVRMFFPIKIPHFTLFPSYIPDLKPCNKREVEKDHHHFFLATKNMPFL